ncbi:hypothetical protein SFC66_04110 [Terribacillus saccharophilus]|uniref:hypothetical protein n=1 Tax=Terribacillus saccharophilus TaxID=361277 RepID=UPI003981C91C
MNEKSSLNLSIIKSKYSQANAEIYHLYSKLGIAESMGLSSASTAELLVSAKELAVHPWICVCWGDKIEKAMLEQLWIYHIIQSETLLLGKKNSIYDYRELNKTRVMRFIIKQYRKAAKNRLMSNMIEIPVSATKPDVHISRENINYLDEKYLSGWNLSLDNPQYIVNEFSQLSIKDGFKLRAYQHWMSVAGAGLIYAIPTDSSLPEVPILEEIPPKPDDALEDFMEAIEGNQLPLSYIQAAICYHELHEFGAYWHSVRWGEDRILPDASISDITDLKEKNFRLKAQELPESLLPRFFMKIPIRL